MVSEQLYRNTLNVDRFVQLRRFPEICGLCCYIGKRVPWSPYNTINPDPSAYDPRSQRCESWSHPIFCYWSLIPYTLLRPCYSVGLAKQQLCTCITLFCSLIFTVSLPSLHDYQRKGPNFTFCRGRERRQRLSVSFPELWYSLRFQLQTENVPTFDELNEME